MDGQEAKNKLKTYIRNYTERYGSQIPIFEIVLFTHPCKEMMFIRDGKEIPSGYPDANLNNMGFFFDLDDAVQAMHENWLDIQETCFHAGFILCRFPGLYESSGEDARIYYIWNEDKQGFFEADEPELFHHVAY